MKKYFCKTCGEFKSRFDIIHVPHCHPQYLVPACKWCHEANVVSSEEIIEEMYYKIVTK